MLWSTKVLHANFPLNLCNIFNHVHENHSHLTRACSQGNLVPPRCKNSFDKCKFTYRGSISFNGLPTTAVSPLPSSIGAFKHTSVFYSNNFFGGFTPCAIPSIFNRIFIFIKLLMHVCNSSSPFQHEPSCARSNGPPDLHYLYNK